MNKRSINVNKKLYKKYWDIEEEITQQKINCLIYSKNSNYLANYKDHLFNDFSDEFLKRLYLLKESTHRIPKIANYYKNYAEFFCKPTFCNFDYNKLIQSYGDCQAELYYKKNFLADKKTNKSREKLDNNIQEDSQEDYDTEKNNKKIDQHYKDKIIFNDSTRQAIDNNSLISVQSSLKIENEFIRKNNRKGSPTLLSKRFINDSLVQELISCDEGFKEIYDKKININAKKAKVSRRQIKSKPNNKAIGLNKFAVITSSSTEKSSQQSVANNTVKSNSRSKNSQQILSNTMMIKFKASNAKTSDKKQQNFKCNLYKTNNIATEEGKMITKLYEFDQIKPKKTNDFSYDTEETHHKNHGLSINNHQSILNKKNLTSCFNVKSIHLNQNTINNNIPVKNSSITSSIEKNILFSTSNSKNYKQSSNKHTNHGSVDYTKKLIKNKNNKNSNYQSILETGEGNTKLKANKSVAKNLNIILNDQKQSNEVKSRNAVKNKNLLLSQTKSNSKCANSYLK